MYNLIHRMVFVSRVFLIAASFSLHMTQCFFPYEIYFFHFFIGFQSILLDVAVAILLLPFTVFCVLYLYPSFILSKLLILNTQKLLVLHVYVTSILLLN